MNAVSVVCDTNPLKTCRLYTTVGTATKSNYLNCHSERYARPERAVAHVQNHIEGSHSASCARFPFMQSTDVDGGGISWHGQQLGGYSWKAWPIHWWIGAPFGSRSGLVDVVPRTPQNARQSMGGWI